MEIDEKALDEEIKLLGSPTEETKEAPKPENTVNDEELKQYVSFFHKIVYVDLLKFDIAPPLMDELNSSGAKLLAKYMPKAEILGKFSSEIAYITALSIVLMQNKQPKREELEYKDVSEHNTN